jgi:hypothetical protein
MYHSSFGQSRNSARTPQHTALLTWILMRLLAYLFQLYPGLYSGVSNNNRRVWLDVYFGDTWCWVLKLCVVVRIRKVCNFLWSNLVCAVIIIIIIISNFRITTSEIKSDSSRIPTYGPLSTSTELNLWDTLHFILTLYICIIYWHDTTLVQPKSVQESGLWVPHGTSFKLFVPGTTYGCTKRSRIRIDCRKIKLVVDAKANLLSTFEGNNRGILAFHFEQSHFSQTALDWRKWA